MNKQKNAIYLKYKQMTQVNLNTFLSEMKKTLQVKFFIEGNNVLLNYLN